MTADVWLLLVAGVAFGFVAGGLFAVLMLVPSELWRGKRRG